MKLSINSSMKSLAQNMTTRRKPKRVKRSLNTSKSFSHSSRMLKTMGANSQMVNIAYTEITATGKTSGNH